MAWYPHCGDCESGCLTTLVDIDYTHVTDGGNINLDVSTYDFPTAQMAVRGQPSSPPGAAATDALVVCYEDIDNFIYGILDVVLSPPLELWRVTIGRRVGGVNTTLIQSSQVNSLSIPQEFALCYRPDLQRISASAFYEAIYVSKHLNYTGPGRKVGKGWVSTPTSFGLAWGYGSNNKGAKQPGVFTPGSGMNGDSCRFCGD